MLQTREIHGQNVAVPPIASILSIVRHKKGAALGGGVALAVLGCMGPSAPTPVAVAPLLHDQIAHAAAVTLKAARDAAPPADATCDEKAFTLLHLNDLQARYSDRIAGRSRYGYIAGYLRSVKAADRSAIVLDAGDDYEKGSLVDLRSLGEATRVILRHLPIDARTIGNHDFAYGAAAVRKDVKESAHPVLSANVKDDAGTFRSSVILKAGCVRVGVVGLTTKNYGSDDQPTAAPFDEVFRQDARYAARLTEEVAKLKDKVDVVIALTHLGLSDDYSLAIRVAGVDLIVGGHSEDKLPKPVAVRKKDGTVTWILQAGRFGEQLGEGRIEIAPPEAGKRRIKFARYSLVPVTEKLPFAEDVGKVVIEMEAKYAPDLLEPIASAKEPYGQYSGMPSLVWEAVKSEWHGDALLLGKDLFWKGIPEGPLTLQSLYDAVLVQREPAGTSGFSSLVSVEISGAELAQLATSFRGAALYTFFLPPRIDPEKTYRVFLEKRAYEHPFFAFSKPLKTEATPRGELIDVLEPYVRNSWKKADVAVVEERDKSKAVE